MFLADAQRRQLDNFSSFPQEKQAVKVRRLHSRINLPNRPAYFTDDMGKKPYPVIRSTADEVGRRVMMTRSDRGEECSTTMTYRP